MKNDGDFKLMTKNEALNKGPINPLVIIPARMASKRLPGKPLADINGVPMIVQVWRRAIEADVGPVVVACAEQEIYQVISDVGGDAVLTNPDHQSGSDRVYEALCSFGSGADFDAIVNIQGDLPTVEPQVVRAALGKHRPYHIPFGLEALFRSPFLRAQREENLYCVVPRFA